MKTLVTLIVPSLLLLTAFSASRSFAAEAGNRTPASDPLPSGYFTGKESDNAGNKTDVQIWLKSVVSASKSTTTYALLRYKKIESASLFKVERLPDGTVIWSEFFQSEKNVLTQAPGGDASYMGETFQLGKGKYRITLIPTDYGRSIGCTANIEVSSDRGIDWVDFSKSAERFSGKKNAQLDVGESVASGTFVFGSDLLTGNYRLTPIFPGLATLRAKVVSPDSNDGRAEERRITAMVVVLKRRRTFLADKQALMLIRLLPMNQNTYLCLSAEDYLEN